MSWVLELAAAPSRGEALGQGSGFVDPLSALLSPVTPLHRFASGEQLPREPSGLEAGRVEQVEAAVVSQRRVAPLAVSDQQVAGVVGSVGPGRQQHRLARVVGASGNAVRQEAGRTL